MNVLQSTHALFWHITKTFLFVTSGIFLNLFYKGPSGTRLNTNIGVFCSLAIIHRIQETSFFDLPNVLILTVFSPIFSNVKIVIDSKTSGVYSTLSIILQLISVLY